MPYKFTLDFDFVDMAMMISIEEGTNLTKRIGEEIETEMENTVTTQEEIQEGETNIKRKEKRIKEIGTKRKSTEETNTMTEERINLEMTGEIVREKRIDTKMRNKRTNIEMTEEISMTDEGTGKRIVTKRINRRVTEKEMIPNQRGKIRSTIEARAMRTEKEIDQQENLEARIETLDLKAEVIRTLEEGQRIVEKTGNLAVIEMRGNPRAVQDLETEREMIVIPEARIHVIPEIKMQRKVKMETLLFAMMGALNS